MANGYAPGMEEEQLRQFLQSQMSQDYGDQEADIESQRRKANLLRELSGDAKGQMVGDVYVAASPLQHMAKLYGAYKGMKGLEGADTAESDLAKLRQTDRADFMAGLNEYEGMEGADMAGMIQSMQASEDPRYAAMGAREDQQLFSTGERTAREVTAKGVRGEARAEAKTIRDEKLALLRATNEPFKAAWDSEGNEIMTYKNAGSKQIVNSQGEPIDLEGMSFSRPRNAKGKGGFTDNQIAVRTEKLQGKVSKIRGVQREIDELDTILVDYAEGGEKFGKNIPGVGLIEGGKGMIGGAARLIQDVVPGGTAGMGQRVSGAMASIANGIIHEFAGSAITQGEMGRILSQLSQGSFDTEKEAMVAMDRVRRALNEQMSELEKGTDQTVVANFKSGFGEETPFYQVSEPNYGQAMPEQTTGSKRAENRSKRPPKAVYTPEDEEDLLSLQAEFR